VWHEFPELAKPELDTTAWEDILRECAARGIQDFLFTGGEATLRQDIWHLMKFARDLMPSARLALFTNGSHMMEDKLIWCKKQKIYLSTSLQGLRTYAIQTGTRRTYAKTLSFIARAAELEWPADVSITVNKTNRHEIADMVAATILSRAKSIQIGPVMLEGKARNHPELAFSHDEWEAVKAEINALPDGGIPRWFVDEMLCECRLQPKELVKSFGGNESRPCTAGKTFGVIGPSGYFRKCLHTIENIEWR
jgi:MoaA/NifB/PqqE/SkfB family radical SAM enzyme